VSKNEEVGGKGGGWWSRSGEDGAECRGERNGGVAALKGTWRGEGNEHRVSLEGTAVILTLKALRRGLVRGGWTVKTTTEAKKVSPERSDSDLVGIALKIWGEKLWQRRFGGRGLGRGRNQKGAT